MNIYNAIKKSSYSIILSFLTVLIGLPSFSQTTITGTDGTVVTSSGGVYDITTSTTRRYSNFAVNTFSEFNAQSFDSSAVNFHHPAGSNFLINRVTSASPAQLNTVINSVLSDSSIGGTMMFACPAGIIAGADAQINVGSLILTTASNINFTSTDSNTYDLMDTTIGGMPTSEGIAVSSVITFANNTMTSRYTLIQNDGLINANGHNTFNGEPASVGIFAEEIQNNGVISIEDSGTPVLDGSIDLVTANTAEYTVTPNMEGHHFVPTTPTNAINTIPAVINYGAIENAGQIIAREGTVHLASSTTRISGMDPAVYSTVVNSGSINVDAFNPDSAAGNVDLFAFHNSSIEHGASVTNTNTGSISAQNNLTAANVTPPGEVTIAAENIDLQPGSVIDVTGVDTSSQSGIVFLGPSGDTGTYDDVVIGDTAPAANTALFINNDTFEMIDNSISINPPIVNIFVSDQISFDGLDIQQEGLNINVEGFGVYNSSGRPLNTISSLSLKTGDNIDFNGQILTANFDTYGDYDKYIRIECQSFSLNSGTGIDLISTGANYPIIMNVNSIWYGSGSGMINNWESVSGEGGILLFSHRTTVPGEYELHVDSTGIDYYHIPTSTPYDFLNFSNLDLGTGGGTLVIGNPYTGSFLERIIVDGLPTNQFMNNGKFHLHTNYTGADAPIEISNADFTITNTDLILSVHDNLNYVTVNALTNNYFQNVALDLQGNVGASIIAQDGGINIAPIASYMFNTTINAIDLNFSTPSGAFGDVYIEGNIGQIYLGNVDAGPANNIDISTFTGSIQFGGTYILNAQDINLEVGSTGQDINLYGNINSNDGMVTIINNNPTTGRINIESSGSITLNGDDINTGIELISLNEINVRGPVQAIIDTTSNTGTTNLLVSSPTLNIYTQSGSTGLLQGEASAGSNSVPVTIETDNFFTDVTGTTPLIISKNASGTTGILFIDRYSPGDVSLNSAGIDLNGGGNDLLFENIDIGTSDARFIAGNNIGAPNINLLTINGAPTNSLGSFNNALLSFNAGYTGAVSAAITINNADFATNNQSVILEIPSTTSTAVNTTNTNFGYLSINTPGTAIITDNAGGITIDDYVIDGITYLSQANNIDISTSTGSNGNINVKGDFVRTSLVSDGNGNIIFTDLNGGIIVDNANANSGLAQIQSTNNLTVSNGATVTGQNVIIENIPDDLGNTNGIIQVNGNIIATNGNVEILSARGDVILSSTGSIEAYSPDSGYGNVKISKRNTTGELRVNLQDGFSISAGTDVTNKNKSVIIGDINLSNPVVVTGSQTGNIASGSPYSTATYFTGPQGNIEAGEVLIAIAGQPLPTPPAAPVTPVTPVDTDTTTDSSINSGDTSSTTSTTTQTDDSTTVQEAIAESEYALQDSEGNVIFVDENGEIVVYSDDTGEVVSLTDNSDNVVQEDFADDSTSSNDSIGLIDGNGLTGDSLDFNTDSESISLGGDDSSANTEGTGSEGNESSDSSTSEDDSTSEDNELANGDDDNNNEDDENGSRSSSGSAVLEALDSNDEPMNSENIQTMRTVFGICQGSGACQEIDTPENNAMLNQTTNLSKENELSADKHGTDFIANTGYHPAGLEGFLMTLKKIEEVTENHGINEYGQNVTPVFSYRHPKTTDRISLIETQLKANGFTKNQNVRLNRKTYRSIVKDIK